MEARRPSGPSEATKTGTARDGSPEVAAERRTSRSSASHPEQEPARGPTSFDLQSLLAASLKQLADSTRSTRACAWSVRPSGEIYVVAATYRDSTPPEAPDAQALRSIQAIWAEDRPLDLGADGPGSPLHDLAIQHGLGCAAPLSSSDGEPIALILLGGPDDPPGSVRPRTLAALDQTVRRLRGPAMADAAVTRLRRLDEEVCRLDRLAVLGDLLAEVAHEIRNPLVSIKTFMHLLPDHLDDEEFQGEFREMVTGELDRLERLLDTLITHAQPGTGPSRPGPTRPGSRIDEVFESMAKLLSQRAGERQVELAVDLGDELGDALPRLAIGEDPLRQILLNLILNALDAAPNASTVSLRGLGTSEEGFAFSVEDCGPGIPPELQARVFEPFFSTRSDRVGGLGLAISKKLIEEAGGTIRAESGEQGGARLRVQLPVFSGG